MLRRIVGRGGPARSTTASWILVGIGVLALWCVLFAMALSPIQAHRSQSNLYATMRGRLAAQTVPVGGSIAAGQPVAMLDIPAIDVHNLVVVEGTSADLLQDGPGHRRDTPLPGQQGVSVLMARSVLFGGPFADIAALHAGAMISVTTGQGDFRYRVESVRRAGDPGPTALLAPAGRLTMITSEGSGSGLDAIRRTVYVDAILVGTAQPDSGGRPSAVDRSETTMEGDAAALPDLAGWLAVLVVVALSAQWLLGRWGRRQVTIVLVPVVLALLWLTAESAAQLLPNLM